MTFQPVLSSGGLIGWRGLQRSMETQTNAFNKSPEILRDTQHFEENIGNIDTAEQLVADRRLMRVALGAFGLSDDVDNRFFIQKILEEGTLNEDALANRLADDRYKDLASAFGFGDFSTPRTKISDFGTGITAQYRERQFEVAVGQQDDTMRLALNATRALGDLGESSASEDTKWFLVLGSTPLRQVFETALNLPSSFGQLDLDTQLEQLKTRATSQFGDDSVSQFSDPIQVDSLVERYLLMSQISSITTASSGQIALTLLQS